MRQLSFYGIALFLTTTFAGFSAATPPNPVVRHGPDAAVAKDQVAFLPDLNGDGKTDACDYLA